jgi:hypothetical protein
VETEEARRRIWQNLRLLLRCRPSKESTAESIAEGAPRSPALVPLAAGVVLYGVILFAGNRLLNDPDSYWHLVVGRWIVAHRAFPTADPFSFTMSGRHWIAKEWLSQILYAGTHALAGWAGMAILAAAAIALAFVFLTRFLTEELAPLPALGPAAVAFVILPRTSGATARVALPVMVAFVGGLVPAATGRCRGWFIPHGALGQSWRLHARDSSHRRRRP